VVSYFTDSARTCVGIEERNSQARQPVCIEVRIVSLKNKKCDKLWTLTLCAVSCWSVNQLVRFSIVSLVRLS